MQCKACSESVHQEDLLHCTGTCKGNFHFTCCGLSDKSFRKYTADKKKKWICVKCSQPSSEVSNESTAAETIKPEANINLKLEIMNLIENQLDELKEFVSDKLDDFKQALDFNNAVIEDLKKTVINLEVVNKNLKSENKRITEENLLIKKEVKDLKLSVTELKQYSRRANLEISDIPESENEIINDILLKMGKLAECDIVNNVVTAHRVPRFVKDRTKSIIVQFKSKPIKDEIQKKLKERKMTTSEIDPSFPDVPIFFNEHLTPELKKVFYLSRNFKKVNNFKFCWVRDGKIYLRKNETSKIYRIQTDEDLNGELPD